MKHQIVFCSLLFIIFTIRCNESVIVPENLASQTPQRKSAVTGTNYYVATTGNDSNAGTLEAPYLTIQKAIGMAVAGNTIYVRGGTYYPTRAVTFASNSGTSVLPIQMLPYPNEHPVIDGGSIPSNYPDIIRIWSEYINISGFEVRNGIGSGIIMIGKHNIVSHMTVHDVRGDGITAIGDYSIVEDCLVYNASMANSNNTVAIQNGAGISACRGTQTTGDMTTDYAILRRNVVHDVYGEGMSLYETTHCTMEDNIVYDGWSTNIYISDATNTLIQRNFVYNTKTMLNGIGNSGSREGIMGGDEKLTPASSYNTFINNIVYGCRVNFIWWGSNGASGMNNFVIANNTFVSATGPANVWLITSNLVNTIFKNNIIYQPSGGTPPIYVSGATSEMTYSNNLWLKYPQPPFTYAIGAGDVNGDPLFANLASPYVPASFRPTGSSPAINAGANVGLSTDYVGNPIIGLPDIGAYEYTALVTAPLTTYYNTQATATATKNNCGTGYIGSTVSYTVAAGKYHSTVSQAAANTLATADLDANTQNYANANGTCTVKPVNVYYNVRMSATATKNSCGLGYTGSSVTFTVSAGRFSSKVSQAAANALASAYLTANKQAYANKYGTCTLSVKTLRRY